MEQNNDLAMGYVMGRDGNGYGNGGFGGFGGDWLAILVILALIGGNGNWGFGGNGGNNMIGYELGKAATQADVASGFNNSAVLSNLNDLKLGQQTGFAEVQQTLCQGFNGVNTGMLQQGYQNQQGFNAIERLISDCCCKLENTFQAGTQRLLDYAHEKETQELRDRLFKADLRESQAVQNAYLVDQIIPRARPTYLTCNPYESSWGWNRGGANGCNGCC